MGAHVLKWIHLQKMKIWIIYCLRHSFLTLWNELLHTNARITNFISLLINEDNSFATVFSCRITNSCNKNKLYQMN